MTRMPSRAAYEQTMAKLASLDDRPAQFDAQIDFGVPELRAQ